MSGTDYGLDPEVIVEFIDESQELLNEVTNIFIVLQTDPSNEQAINKIFRTVHTIKGNASFFNLMKVTSLAHIMEDLINLLRDGSVKFNESVLKILINGTDCLETMLNNVRKLNPEVDDEDAFNNLLDKISSQVDDGRKCDPSSTWKVLNKDIGIFKNNFFTEDLNLQHTWQRIVDSFNKLSPLAEDLVEPKIVSNDESKQATPSKGSNPKELIENILGEGLENNLNDDQAKEILSALKNLEAIVDETSQAVIDEILNSYKSIVPKEGFTPFLGEMIITKIAGITFNDESLTKSINFTKTQDNTLTKSNKTMRVYESSIDNFFDSVGELVVLGEMYDYIYKRFSATFGSDRNVVALKKNNEIFRDVSNELQKSVLEIRQVPVKGLVQRALRIVHDVATVKDKKIKVEIKGEDILVDKSLIEMMEGPFVHMVRNAADHGIETIQERQQKGKPEEGNIWIEVTEDESLLFVTIKDDGGGINKEVVLNKAVEKGIIEKENVSTLSEENIYAFLFAPGFSTAKDVTEISGRGVGLDVVKKNIESIGGHIHIQSTLDEGSIFTIDAPKSVTVKIIQGLLVESKENKFILPMASVGEVFVVLEEAIQSIKGYHDSLLHHDKVYPIIKLDKLLDLNADEINREHKGVIITSSKKEFVLLVDKVLGIQQVVVKEIEGIVGKSDLVAGGAILGDARVAIVLNLDTILC